MGYYIELIAGKFHLREKRPRDGYKSFVHGSQALKHSEYLARIKKEWFHRNEFNNHG